MSTRDSALAVLAKAPVAGAVKSRLVPPLTPDQAAELCRALLLDQLAHLRALAGSDLFLVFAPAEAEKQMKSLAPNEYRLFPQQGADLGARMHGVFTELFGAGYKRVVLIGGDLAPLPRDYLLEAFGFLDAPNRRVVLGPSLDGGYYLIGANQPVPQLFDGMSWSHDQVLAQTRMTLRALNIRYHLLPEWFDVDRPEDIGRLRSHCEARRDGVMPNTTAWLEKCGKRRGFDSAF